MQAHAPDRPRPVNKNLGSGLVYTNLVPGSVNTNWVPEPINTNWGPGLRARHRAGGQEIQILMILGI